MDSKGSANGWWEDFPTKTCIDSLHHYHLYSGMPLAKDLPTACQTQMFSNKGGAIHAAAIPGGKILSMWVRT